MHIDDYGEQVRKHANVNSIDELDTALTELLAWETPRVWCLFEPNSGRGISFAAGAGVCGMVQWAIEGGPPWYFHVGAGGTPFTALWGGHDHEALPQDVLTGDELHAVLSHFVTSGGKRLPGVQWECIKS